VKAKAKAEEKEYERGGEKEKMRSGKSTSI